MSQSAVSDYIRGKTEGHFQKLRQENNGNPTIREAVWKSSVKTKIAGLALVTMPLVIIGGEMAQEGITKPFKTGIEGVSHFLGNAKNIGSCALDQGINNCEVTVNTPPAPSTETTLLP